MSRRLSIKEVWRINQLFYLICKDLQELLNHIPTSMTEQSANAALSCIIEYDNRLSMYQNNPPQIPFDDGTDLSLDRSNLLRWRDYIMEENEIKTALKVIDDCSHISIVIQKLRVISELLQIRFNSLDYLTYMENMFKDIHMWISFNSMTNKFDNRIIEDSVDDMSMIEYVSTFSQHRSCEKEYQILLQDNIYPLFKDHIKAVAISGLFSEMSSISKYKPERYISLIATIVSILYKGNLLKKNYKTALCVVFDTLGIKERIENHKPSRYIGPNNKGHYSKNLYDAVAILGKYIDVPEQFTSYRNAM